MNATAPAAVPLSMSLLMRLAPGLLLIAALLLLFRDTAVAMVTIWIRSETFTHAFLVPPIVIWLAWRRRARLAVLPVKPVPWLLLPIAGVCLLWLLGELASVNSATQFALVTLIVLSVPAVFGLAVARELTFPLLFLYFAVPVGEFLVPQMMESTADFTVAALQFTGIPVYREGLQFVIPSGNWSVVEACSGVRYLIASFMVGTLFAYLNFTSPKRRALFMLVSLAVPVVANWLRAYIIVMLGHLSGNVLAAGVDHIIYGWVFFGIVIGLMFMIGARWAQPDNLDQPITTALHSTAAATPATASWVLAGCVVAMLLATQAAMWKLDAANTGAAPPRLLLQAPAAGWQAEPVQALNPPWLPAFKNTSAVAEQRYRQAADAPDGGVSVWLGYYRDQDYTRKLVTSSNGLVNTAPEERWAQAATGATRTVIDGSDVAFRTATLRGSTDAGAIGVPRVRVWQLYWVGGQVTTSDAQAKLRLAFNRLLGRGDDGAVLLIHTAMTQDNQSAPADARIEAFVRANLKPLLSALDATRAGR